MVFAQLLLVAITIWLALRIHAAPAYRIALMLFAISIVGIALLYAIGVRISWRLPAGVAGRRTGCGASLRHPGAHNDMPDVDEIVTGRRREGSFAGVMTFVRKLMQSAAIFVVSQVLNFAGLCRA